MDRRRAVAWAAALGGALAGEAAWEGAVQVRALGAPPGWSRDRVEVPYRLADLSGPLPHRPDAWSLEFHQAMRWTPGEGRVHPAGIALAAELPEDGQLEVWTAAPAHGRQPGAVGLVLERVGEPSATVVDGDGRALRCDGTLPPPGPEPVRAAIGPVAGGVEAAVGAARVRCRAEIGTLGPALRPGLRRVRVRDLAVDGAPVPPPGPRGRALWWGLGAVLAAAVARLELWTGARPAVVLLTTLPLLLSAPLLGHDLRPFVEAARAPWLPAAWLPLLAGLVPVLALKALHHFARLAREAPHDDLPPERRRDWPATAVAAALLPASLAYAGPPGALAPAIAGLVAIAAVPVAGLLLVRGAAALGARRPRRAATLLGAAFTGAALLVAATHPLHRAAVPLLAGAALAGAAVAWVHANLDRARAPNATSLVLSVAALALIEAGLRHTPAGAGWSERAGGMRPDDVFAWVPAVWDDFRRFDEARPTAYPDRGYPVAVPPRRPGVARVVALGGSTTGGAWQNDDLSEFYPALLDAMLGPRVEVVNQGVGGWTTWHVRRYLERALDELDPDAVTLYVGHNDLLTPVPAPYAELYAAWRAHGGRVARTAAMLRRFRLYQGLRYVLTALRPPGERVAVPLDDAEDNLRRVVELVTARGGRVLLASEGLDPDPGPLSAYFAMMRAIAAEREDVGFVDTAALLHEHRGERVFLDDCHLTPAGHRVVAEAMARALRELGVVP